MSFEMAKKLLSQKRQIMSQIFVNNGTLVILCLLETKESQFYSYLTIF